MLDIINSQSDGIKHLVTLLLQLFTGYIPQGFAFVLFVYAYSKTKINVKNYLLSGAILAFTIFLVRNMPINFGVHTILNLLALIAFSILINKFPLNYSFFSSLIFNILISHFLTPFTFLNLFFLLLL